MQRLLQAGAAPCPAPQLLQRLQPHGAVSALPHARHTLRQAAALLLHAPAGEGAAGVAIARGPRPGQVAAAAASDGGPIHRLGPGAAVARAGRTAPRRVLPPAADARAVDGVSFH